MLSESDGMAKPDIIIDECLCWIINKHKILDPEIWMQLCSETFDDDEIEDSKNLLLSLLSEASISNAFKKRRNRGDKFDSKKIKNLRDILTLLLEKGLNPMPKIAALDLGKLPPINFVDVDVSVLFSRIQKGNVTVKLLKEAISTLSESNDGLCQMINDLDQRMKNLEISNPREKSDKVIILEETIISEPSKIDDIDDCEKFIDKHMEEIPFECSGCDSRFTSEAELIDHRVIHDPISIKNYNCHICNHKALSDTDLSTHMLLHKIYNCDTKGCDINSSSEDAMKTHKENHTYEKTYKNNGCDVIYNCFVCHSKFNKYEELEIHFLSTHGEGQNAEGKKNDANNDLQNIISNEPEIVALPFKCTECKLAFRENAERESHMFSMHSFDCPKCKFKSLTGHGLMVHMKAHETVNKLVSDKYISSHEIKHTGKKPYNIEKPYECDSCGLRCKTESELKAHLDITHVINCEQCSFRCDTTDMLTMHMKIHYVHKSAEYSDERSLKPFSCMQCDYKCKDRRVFEYHINMPHIFLCTECKYKCTGEDFLSDHMELHSKLNEFKCTECDYECTSKELLLAHMANHKKNAGTKNHKDSSGINNHRRRSRQDSTSNTTVWDKLSLNELARQHFIDSLVSNDGFSAPCKNGKPIRVKELMADKSTENTPTKHRNRAGVVGTAIDSNITIARDRRLGKVFATRYGPNVGITSVKSNLENKLKETTGINHTVNVESVKTKYDSYSSFKITCLCSDINILYNPSIWPKGCFVKRWIDPRGTRGGITGTSYQ